MSTNQCALVTGASRGIGLEIARSLLEAGYQVVGTATGVAGIANIESELCANFEGAIALTLDLTKDDSIDSLLETAKEHDLNFDVLVNNAGITRDNLLLRMKDDEWNDVIATNLTAVFKLTKRLIRPMLKARAGRIINIGSVVGTSGNPGQANYAAAKAGLLGFTRSLAQEVANRGITVNAIAPGMIDTDMTQALSESQREQLLAQIPAGRLGNAKEIAATVVFLASAGAAYITGETIHINGGMYMN